MKVHVIFGEVTISSSRITAGGNAVVDAVDSTGSLRTLLTASQYWSKPAYRRWQQRTAEKAAAAKA